jgi:ankyrin repeat protein
MLLERGADPNACNHQSETPLMLATIAEQTELVDCLLEAGADQ